jgi:hypothetical protein
MDRFFPFVANELQFVVTAALEEYLSDIFCSLHHWMIVASITR